MIFDLSKPIDIKKFKLKVESFIESEYIVDLKIKRLKRSLRHNAYLHVCITLFAIEFGYSLNEAKTLLKREGNLIYHKNGKSFLKQTRSMDSKELTDFIEWIRNYSGKNGIYIPTSKEYLQHQIEIDKTINQYKNQL